MIFCDVQIASDSELPRHSCNGQGPGSLRLQRQTTEQSFGKHWQHRLFSFATHFLTSKWIFGIFFRRESHMTVHTFGKWWMAPENTNLPGCSLMCLDFADMLLSVGFGNDSKSSMRTTSLGVRVRLSLTAFQNGSHGSWPPWVLTSRH